MFAFQLHVPSNGSLGVVEIGLEAADTAVALVELGTKCGELAGASVEVSGNCLSRPSCRSKQRRAPPAKICYEVSNLPAFNADFYNTVRADLELVEQVTVPPRDARTFLVPAGHIARVVSVEGPQVGDLNLWCSDNLSERFFSGKTRQLHATHVTTGDRLWSCLPYLRPLATLTQDTLDWYGFDADGGGVHDVIGTRCDPYTNFVLNGVDYHHCCHSNLTRALADYLKQVPLAVEHHIHDVLNVFMCTGFTRDTQQYFMKASPVRPGDYLEFFAETNLLGALSTCPGGDCGSTHSDDSTRCYPLQVEVYRSSAPVMDNWKSKAENGYSRTHGVPHV